MKIILKQEISLSHHLEEEQIEQGNQPCLFRVNLCIWRI